MECVECHHTMTADGKQGPYVAGEEKKCASCHNDSMPNAKLNSFKNILPMNAAKAAIRLATRAKTAPPSAAAAT